MVPGVSIKMAKAAAVVRSAVMQHSNNAWLTGSGVAPVDPVRTRPRRNRLRQLGLGGASSGSWRYWSRFFAPSPDVRWARLQNSNRRVACLFAWLNSQDEQRKAHA